MAITITKRPYTYNLSGNPVMYELYSQLASENANIYFEVRIKFTPANNISFAEVVTLPVYPVAGTAKLDIKEILDSKLEYDLPDFNVNEKTATLAPGQTGLFYIEFREIVTDGSNPAWDDSESDYRRFVMKAGLDYFKYRGDNFWENYFNDNNPFLTWQQSGRLASRTERMYLAFLNKTELPSFTEGEETVGPGLWTGMKVYYADGTNSIIEYVEVTDYSKDLVNFIPCGAAQWALDTIDPSKRILYWEVGMYYTSDFANTKTALNTPFKFYADNRNDYNAITLNYRNSLSGLDSVRIRGLIDYNLEYSFEQQDRTFLPDYFSGKSITPNRVIANSREKLIYKGDIGHLGKEEQDRMRDSNLVRDVWWEIGEKWWPVNIITASQRMRNTDDHRWVFPIEFTLAADADRFYTPKAVELGDRTFATNVCTAVISNIGITVEASGSVRDVTVDFDVDPLTIETYTYKIPGVHTDPITANIADLPLVIADLPENADYIIELRPICAGGILGKKFTAAFNTTGTGGEGIGGGSGGSGESSIENGSGGGQVVIVEVDTVEVFANYLSAGASGAFTVADGADKEFVLTFPHENTYATLVSNGNTYYPVVDGTTMTFTNVDVVSGVVIIFW